MPDCELAALELSLWKSTDNSPLPTSGPRPICRTPCIIVPDLMIKSVELHGPGDALGVWDLCLPVLGL